MKTGARLIRDFVLSHPEYKHDSIVSNSIVYDLVKRIDGYSELQEQIFEEAMSKSYFGQETDAFSKADL